MPSICTVCNNWVDNGFGNYRCTLGKAKKQIVQFNGINASADLPEPDTTSGVCTFYGVKP